MKREEIKSNTTELNDDALENVSGGSFDAPVTCPICGKTMRE